MHSSLMLLFSTLFASFRSRLALQTEILALRHQITVLRRSVNRATLRAYFSYYHDSRCHLGLNKDSPESREIQLRDMEWRIRVGDYGVIYEIHDQQLVIVVVTLGNRKDVYR
jgi:hypothetical protein